MNQPPLKPSPRFSRAARAERDRLHRRRAQLVQRRRQLQEKVNGLGDEISALDGQLSLLERLADEQGGGELTEIRAGDSGRSEALSGAMIRTVAVPLLIRLHGSSPIHYRDWYALLEQEGFAVAGKRPDAVFLNQVSRSPLVRNTTDAGFYVVDVEAVDRLRAQLQSHQEELGKSLSDLPGDSSSLEARRVRQHELSTGIKRIERELGEAVSALEAAEENSAVHQSQAKAA